MPLSIVRYIAIGTTFWINSY